MVILWTDNPWLCVTIISLVLCLTAWHTFLSICIHVYTRNTYKEKQMHPNLLHTQTCSKDEKEPLTFISPPPVLFRSNLQQS